jgi:hypothetical protein
VPGIQHAQVETRAVFQRDQEFACLCRIAARGDRQRLACTGGDADFLYQREVVAGNPKIYGQLVQTLAPYTKVTQAEAASTAPAALPAPAGETGLTPEAALSASLGITQAAVDAAPAAPTKPRGVRIRKSDVKPT